LYFFGIEFERVLWEFEAFLNERGEFADAAAFFA
jgi:hypothetical protein